MIDKICEILESPRFWQIVAAGIVIWLQTNNWKLGVISILGGSVTVGSLDSIATKISGK